MKRSILAILLASSVFLCACDRTQNAQPTNSAEEAFDGDDVREEFVFTRENFPRMDGSTSTVPLAEAIACVLLGEPRSDVAELVEFNRTTQSLRNLAAGLCDILIVSEPSPEAFAELEQQGFVYEIAPIATEALVFIVNASNPVDNLTLEQIQGIYSGNITNWSHVGGDDIEIIPFQRNAESGSQVLMDKLVMAGIGMIDPPTMKYMVAFSMGMLIDAVRGFDGSANAIGFTMYYYAEEMRMAEGLKILSVEGIAPGDDSIRNNQYPLLNPYFVIISANEAEDSPARVMYNWLLSAQGQYLVNSEGYIGIRK